MTDIDKLFRESISVKQAIIDSNASDVIMKMATVISRSIEAGGRLFICGNGGSAADAQHLAAELTVRFRPDVVRQPLPAISLAFDSSNLTACGNDFSFDEIFSRNLEALASAGDVLVVLSTSGNSKNILQVLSKAEKIGVTSCAFLGCDGGESKNLSDIQYIVPSSNTARIQESHIMLGHALMQCIEDKLIESKYIRLQEDK